MLADASKPTTALGIALVVETAGSALLLIARAQPLAYAAVILIGIGFGMSYIAIAAAFSSFFGRKAFATTTGTRFLIGGVFNAAMPPLAGLAYERTGSYTPAFVALVVFGLIGALVAFTHPAAAARGGRARGRRRRLERRTCLAPSRHELGEAVACCTKESSR